jgi:hypothetical protein
MLVDLRQLAFAIPTRTQIRELALDALAFGFE